MTVLFITRSPLHRGNSTGQTLCNFFDCTAFPKENYDLHIITLDSPAYGTTERGFAVSTLHIGNRDLLRGRIRHAEFGMRKEETDISPSPIPSSHPSTAESPATAPPTPSAMPHAARRILHSVKASTTLRYLAYIPRDLLWWTTSRRWKRAVRDYIETIKPDVLFFPTSGQSYHHRVMEYVCRLTEGSTRLILFHGDDHYTLRTGSRNPAFYPRRLFERARIKRAVQLCDTQLGASEWQCRAYEAGMGKPCTFLSKSADFSRAPQLIPTQSPQAPLSLVYTGNILLGRWDSLVYLARLLDRLPTDGLAVTLSVYSANPLTEKMKKDLSRLSSLCFKGPVPPDDIPGIQRNADILVHAESFARTNRAIVRQSFSTKLVDYLHAARPILAVGPRDVASVAYLSEHNAALCLDGPSHEDEDIAALERLLDPAVREDCAERAYALGRERHDEQVMREILKRVVEGKYTFLNKSSFPS